MGETKYEPSVTYPARQGLTTGTPSGGTSGGTPATMVEEEEAELEWERDPTYEEVA